MKCGCKMNLKETKEYKNIDRRLDENIIQMFKEIGMKPPTKKKLQNCKNTFIEMFVDVDRLKGLIIEHTSNELMKVFISELPTQQEGNQSATWGVRL